MADNVQFPIATYETLGGAIIDKETLNVTPDGLISTKLTASDVAAAIADLNAIIEQSRSDLVASLALINNSGEPSEDVSIESELVKIQANIYDIQSAINQKGVQVANDVPLADYGNAIRQIVDKSGLHVVYWFSEPEHITYQTPLSKSEICHSFVFNAKRIVFQEGKRIKLLNHDKSEELTTHRMDINIVSDNVLEVDIRNLPLGEYRLYLQIESGFVIDSDGRANEFFEIPLYAFITDTETCSIVISTTTSNQKVLFNLDSFSFMEGYDANNSWIDWGDGSAFEQFGQFLHTYATVGKYVIRLHGACPHRIVSGASTSDTTINGMLVWQELNARILYNEFISNAFSVGHPYPATKLQSVYFTGIDKLTTYLANASHQLYAFTNCTALSKVNLPDVKKIYLSENPPDNQSLLIDLFTGCSQLKTLELNNLEEVFISPFMTSDTSVSTSIYFLRSLNLIEVQLKSLQFIYFYGRTGGQNGVTVNKCSTLYLQFAYNSVQNLELPELLNCSFFKEADYELKNNVIGSSSYYFEPFYRIRGQICELPKLKHLDRINLPKTTQNDFILANYFYSKSFRESLFNTLNLASLETIQSCEADGLYLSRKTTAAGSADKTFAFYNQTFFGCSNLLNLDLPKLRLVSHIKTSTTNQTGGNVFKFYNNCFAGLHRIRHLRLPQIQHIGKHTEVVAGGGDGSVFTAFGQLTLTSSGSRPTLEFGEYGSKEPMNYAEIFGQQCFARINTSATGIDSSSAVTAANSWAINVIFNQPSTGSNMTYLSSSYISTSRAEQWLLCWMPFIHIFISYEDKDKVINNTWLGIQWGSITILPPQP
jgi:hypothetical protein